MKEERHRAECLIHRGLGRVEFFDLTGEQMADLGPLIEQFRAEGRDRFSFHAPIIRPEDFPHSGVTCFFLSEEKDKREKSFSLLWRTLNEARRWGADYVVSHLTFGPTDSKDPALALKLAREACARMAGMSAASAIPLDLEFAAYSDGFHEAGAFAAVVSEHEELGVCIDIGHAYLGAQGRNRNYLDDIAALAPRARSMHLWNTTGPEHTKEHHHSPLHPNQRPEDGWLDVEAILGIVIVQNPHINIVFEYPVEAVTREIRQGYDWIAEMIDRFRQG